MNQSTTRFDPNKGLLDALCALFNDDRRRSVESLLTLSASLNVDGLFPETLSVCEEFVGLGRLASLTDINLSVPANSSCQSFGIKPGNYGTNEVVDMLRSLKNHPDAIQFIADMLEV